MVDGAAFYAEEEMDQLNLMILVKILITKIPRSYFWQKKQETFFRYPA